MSTPSTPSSSPRPKSQITWICQHCSELSALELLRILQLRAEVFVVEQECIYEDPDHFDADALHLQAFENNTLVAYARLLPPRARFAEASIGRVLTRRSHRGLGLGRKLMKEAMERCTMAYQCNEIRLSAQVYLLKFYTDLGFVEQSAHYLEDGIPHVEMLWKSPGSKQA